MFQYLENERGSAIAMLLLIAVVLLILGTALITNAITEKKIAVHQELGTSLYYIAEAGLEEAIAVKIKDFDFIDNIENISCGEGKYDVEINKETEFKHCIESTGELKGKKLTLGAIVELSDLYKKAVLVSENLTIEKTTINGDLHCNNHLSIKGPENRLLPTGELAGSLTYSCPVNKIDWEGGNGSIEVKGELYSKGNPFPGDWRVEPIPLPEIDLNQILNQHLFTKISGKKEWREAPGYGKVLDKDGKERQYLYIEKGDLTISPGPGEEFIFDGILVVDGDVEIKGSGRVNFEGMIVAKGDLFVKNKVNVGLEDKKVVVLAADKDVKVFGEQNDCPENPVFGGDLLLFSKGGEVTIGHQKMKGEQFIMDGIIFAKKTAIYNCNLTYIPGLSDMRQRYFPAYGLVVTAWFQP
ncbi:MAG: PilX N-terminal domain-containing pilus assembly protein [Dethiobacteria bacterium]|jgi:cytoskeletal protein CcmA (bactofilin family)|nr:PilX N-terminal domain-containing pilus assembly protein [Bacillota bacterium]HOB28328.1 PilX N-terminal domain-containing pilus assembly protein [Bacillota bacterium]HPZ41294.1 PilX N-terminal domain-containing pilus assembly protein [Bacillota bacterium]